MVVVRAHGFERSLIDGVAELAQGQGRDGPARGVRVRREVRVHRVERGSVLFLEDRAAPEEGEAESEEGDVARVKHGPTVLRGPP